MPTDVQKRYRSNQQRNGKRRKGTAEESIISKLKRLELLLYWYRHTVETSPEVLELLETVPMDIEYYEGRAANRAAGRASDDYGD